MTWGAVAGGTIAAAGAIGSSAMADKPGTATGTPQYLPGTAMAGLGTSAYAARRLNPLLQPDERMELNSVYDRLFNEQKIVEEQMRRRMGQFPGVVGPEKFEEMRRMQDTMLKTRVGTEVDYRAKRAATAAALLAQMGSRGSSQESKSTGPVLGAGGPMGEGAGMAASALIDKYNTPGAAPPINPSAASQQTADKLIGQGMGLSSIPVSQLPKTSTFSLVQ